MAKVVGDIAVKVSADTSPLERGMKRAGGSVNDFSDQSKKMAENVAKAGRIVVASMAAIATGVLAAASKAATAGVEIRNLAAVAGTSATEFQKMAAASRNFGIEQEKLSDILKDVNDKFGDYMATGAGPLADFFENIAPKIGVTAEAFANLSGQDALLLYVQSLEKAGLSQQQMTFYMEALASDATGLLPILRNGGAEMRRLGDEAERAGRIMSEETVAAAAEMDRELRELSDTLRTQATEAILEYKDEIAAVADFLVNSLIPRLAQLGELLGTVALGWSTMANAASDAISPMMRALNLMNETGPGAQLTPENIEAGAADVRSANALGGGDPSSTGQFYVDENGNVQSYGAGTPSIPGITAPERLYSGRGNASGPTPDEALEAAIDARRAAWEALQSHNTEVETEEERHAGRVAEIREEHIEDMAALEAAAQRARLQDIGGAFGDLSSLMQSENKKLFKIGQAAALAEATISGYQAAVDAWQKGMKIGGPPVAAAFTAASLAKTGALIGQISSASASGGGSSGAAAGGATAAAGSTQQAPATTFAFTLRNDPMGFGESFARQLIEQLNATQRNGGQIRGVLA